MIAKVSGLNTGGVMIDSRKKTRSLPFKNNSSETYDNSYNHEYRQKQRDAVWTGVLVILGSALFLFGCFLFSGGKKIK